MNYWLLIPTFIAVFTGFGFVIMAWSDMRSATVRHNDYLVIIFPSLMLCVGFYGLVLLNPPSVFLYWLMVPVKFIASCFIAVFVWIAEILIFAWVAKTFFATAPESPIDHEG